MHVEKYCSSIAILLAVLLIPVSGLGVEPLLRLYDMSPVSTTNPVVASVKEYGIEIPLNELSAYINRWMPPEKKHDTLTSAEKLRYLQQLLDDHLLLWDGYQKQLDHAPELVAQLDYTLRLDLEAALVQHELEQKAPKTDDDKEKVIDALEDRVFKNSKIQIDQPAYDELKDIVNASDGGEPDVQKLTDARRNQVLVRYDGGTLSIGDCLDNYYNVPSGDRPDILDPADLLPIIRSAIISPLMQAEGRKEGLMSSSWVQTDLQLNRNVLTKMAMLSWLARQGHAQREAPGWDDRVKQWYENNKNRYLIHEADGKETLLSYETNKRTVMDDCEADIVNRIRAEEVRSLRQSHTIVIHDRILENLSPPKSTTGREPNENVDKRNKNAIGSSS